MEKSYIINPVTQSRIEDLTGKKFGKLTVLELDVEKMLQRSKENKRSRAYWICECSCKDKIIISTTVEKLKSGHTQSCGCVREGKRLVDLTGKVFGYLTVIKLDRDRMNKDIDDKTYWLCKCDCENPKLISVSASNLNFNNTKSCGCKSYDSVANYYKTKAINGESFANESINIFGNDFIKKYWSDNNTSSPWEILKSSNKKVLLKNIGHEDYEIEPYNLFKRTIEQHIRTARKMDSFAQWGIDNLGDNFIKIYWSEKNTLNPWDVGKTSKQKVWIKCQEKDYHKDYEITCGSFYNGNRCSYCAHRKIHPKDSLGQYIVDNFGQSFLDLIWSDKNKKSAFEYSVNSHLESWWKCPENKHEDFLRRIDYSYRCDFRCPSCKINLGETKIEEILSVIKLKFKPQYKFKGLLGLGNKQLSYDYYVPLYNLLIEYQGIQHFEQVEWFGGEKRFIQQVKHDKRKREYAKLNNINLLEIPYWDFDNIETIILEKLSKLELTQAI